MNSSDDDGELLPMALPIEGADEDFDLDIPPTSGMEYLRRVQIEAKNCPSIVVADIDPNVYSDRQTIKVQRSAGLHAAPCGLAPSADWQRTQNANFAQLRQKLSKHKAKIKKEKIKPSKKLPLYDDVEGWCRFCFGCLQPKQQKSGGSNSESTSGLSVEGSTSLPPLLSIVAHMDQLTIIQVLEYHINWFEATGFSQVQGQWFYAMLACLEKPLVPEACSLLRTLARNCANLRATMDTESSTHLAAMNLFITLVSQYFDQSDLADAT